MAFERAEGDDERHAAGILPRDGHARRDAPAGAAAAESSADRCCRSRASSTTSSRSTRTTTSVSGRSGCRRAEGASRRAIARPAVGFRPHVARHRPQRVQGHLRPRHRLLRHLPAAPARAHRLRARAVSRRAPGQPRAPRGGEDTEEALLRAPRASRASRPRRSALAGGSRSSERPAQSVAATLAAVEVPDVNSPPASARARSPRPTRRPGRRTPSTSSRPGRRRSTGTSSCGCRRRACRARRSRPAARPVPVLDPQPRAAVDDALVLGDVAGGVTRPAPRWPGWSVGDHAAARRRSPARPSGPARRRA